MEEIEISSVLIVVLAVCLHLIAVFLGYRFHLWLLDKTSTTSSWSSWWNKQTAVVFDDNVSTANLSYPQLAFLQTFGLWLLVVGLVAGWRPVILLIVLVGLILLMREYPNDGNMPQNYIYVAVLGYIAWLAVLATTTALLLWPLRSRYDVGYLDEEYFQTVAIGGAVTSSFVGALAFIAFCIQRRRAVQGMESSLL